MIIAGWIIRREVDETPAFKEEGSHNAVPRSPVIEAIQTSWPDMIRVVCMALMNTIPVVTTVFGAAYAVQAAYGIGFHKDVYLWIPVLGNILACVVIPFVGNLSRQDRPASADHRRRARLGPALLRLPLRDLDPLVPLAIVMSLLMWGIVYQGYNAVFPSFYPELFPTRTRVSSMAISQNIGTTITALLPALFATVAPPGSTNVPMTVGAIAFGITCIAAVAAWSARETYRVHMNDLGNPNAVPVAEGRATTGCATQVDRQRRAGLTRPASRPAPRRPHAVSRSTRPCSPDHGSARDDRGITQPKHRDHPARPDRRQHRPLAVAAAARTRRAAARASRSPTTASSRRTSATTSRRSSTTRRADGYRGLNITYPYKERVVARCHRRRPAGGARSAPSTPCVFDADGPRGYNTDWSGFMAAYRHAFGDRPPGAVCMIGAGGVGKAVAFGLLDLGMTDLRLVERDLPKAEALAEALRAAAPGPDRHGHRRRRPRAPRAPPASSTARRSAWSATTARRCRAR